MRIAAALLAILSMVPAAVAIKPAREGASVEATLRNLNRQLAVPPDYSNLQCSDRVEISLTSDRAEIVVTYRMIDKHGKFRKELPPRYIYRIPVESVKTAYISGPWTRNDRVIIRTYGRQVVKIGPLWDCWHNRLKKVPRERIFDNADIRLHGATNEQLYRLADTFRHLVKLLQSEANATPLHSAPHAPEPGRKTRHSPASGR